MQAQHVPQTVVAILDPDALSSRAEQTGEEFQRLAEQSAGKVLELDLARVGFVEGTGLGVLVRLHKQMKDSGGRLVVRNPGAVVAEVLRVTHLDRVLTVVHEPEPDTCIIVPAE
jgi:anti-anti-sigma factor